MSQADEILAYLQTGKSLTPLDALNKFGCFRLGARVFELRRQGYNIKDIGKKNFSEYSLGGDNEGMRQESSGHTEPIDRVHERPDSPPIHFDTKKKDQQVFNFK